MGQIKIGRIHIATALAALLVLTPMAVPSAWADDEEEEKSTYTRVALWEVDRDHWGAFTEFFEKNEQPIVEKLFSDGVITEWGIDANTLHKPDGYTHSTWYSADSMSALAKAGEAYDDAWKALGGDLDKEFNAMIGRHRDYVLETEGMRASAATLDGGYFQGHTVQLAQGKGRDFNSYWEHRMKPIYEQLLTDGTIVAYGLSSEAVVTNHPRNIDWWYVMADADALDKVEIAFDSSWGDMDKEGRRARWVSIMDTVEEGTYRSWMTAIIHMQVAAH
jgi:hypothetical protein